MCPQWETEKHMPEREKGIEISFSLKGQEKEALQYLLTASQRIEHHIQLSRWHLLCNDKQQLGILKIHVIMEKKYPKDLKPSINSNEQINVMNLIM